MSLRSRVDRDLLEPLDAFLALLGPHYVGKSVAASRRARFKELFDDPRPFGSICPQVSRKEAFAPGLNEAPPVRVMVYRPPAIEESSACILFFHGGGFTLGGIDEEDSLVASFALEVGCVVVSVEYRLAPETRHPGPVEDCYAALEWAAARADELAIDAQRIAVMGGSAGGALAANVALMARDRGGPALAFQMLLFPMLDDRMAGHSNVEFDGLGVWDASASRNAWEALYLGTESGLAIPAEAQIARYAEAADTSCYASASRTEDLARLPAAYIETCELEVLLDENMDYARRLIAAGVSTELHVRPGTYHAFDRFAPDAPVSKASIQARVAAMKRALAIS